MSKYDELMKEAKEIRAKSRGFGHAQKSALLRQAVKLEAQAKELPSVKKKKKVEEPKVEEPKINTFNSDFNDESL